MASYTQIIAAAKKEFLAGWRAGATGAIVDRPPSDSVFWHGYKSGEADQKQAETLFGSECERDIYGVPEQVDSESAPKTSTNEYKTQGMLWSSEPGDTPVIVDKNGETVVQLDEDVFPVGCRNSEYGTFVIRIEFTPDDSAEAEKK